MAMHKIFGRAPELKGQTHPPEIQDDQVSYLGSVTDSKPHICSVAENCRCFDCHVRDKTNVIIISHDHIVHHRLRWNCAHCPCFDLPQSNLSSPQNQTYRVFGKLCRLTVASLHCPTSCMQFATIVRRSTQLSITTHACIILSVSTSDLVWTQRFWTTRRQLGDLSLVLSRWMIYRQVSFDGEGDTSGC